MVPAHVTRLRYEHCRASAEQLLAIPDAMAWCWAEGGHWRQRIEPAVTAVDGSKPAPGSAKPGSPTVRMAAGLTSMQLLLKALPSVGDSDRPDTIDPPGQFRKDSVRLGVRIGVTASDDLCAFDSGEDAVQWLIALRVRLAELLPDHPRT